MIFKVFNKEELENLFSLFTRDYRVIAPIEKSRESDGKPIYGFRRARKFSQLRLDFTMTHLPAKRYFLPFKEELASFSINEGDWEKSTDYKVDQPIVMFRSPRADTEADMRAVVEDDCESAERVKKKKRHTSEPTS